MLYSVLASATARGEYCAWVDANGCFDPESAAQAGVDLRRVLWVNAMPATTLATTFPNTPAITSAVRPRFNDGKGDQDSSPAPIVKAMQAVDLILHSGGFGLIVLDLCEVANQDLNRIPLSYWYRFRRAVETSRGSLVVACHVAVAKNCASLKWEAQRDQVRWQGSAAWPLFAGLDARIAVKKQHWTIHEQTQPSALQAAG